MSYVGTAVFAFEVVLMTLTTLSETEMERMDNQKALALQAGSRVSDNR